MYGDKYLWFVIYLFTFGIIFMFIRFSVDGTHDAKYFKGKNHQIFVVYMLLLLAWKAHNKQFKAIYHIEIWQLKLPRKLARKLHQKLLKSLLSQATKVCFLHPCLLFVQCTFFFILLYPFRLTLKLSDMITESVLALAERGGSSRQALKKYIKDKYPVGSTFDTHFNLAIRKGVEAGEFSQPKGASGPIKVSKKVKEPTAEKKSSTAKVSKKTTAEKKTNSAKKTTPVKKPATVKETSDKKSVAKKTSSKSAPAKKAPADKTPAKKTSAAKKSSTEKVAPKKVTKKDSAKKASAKKASVKKSSTKKTKK